MAKLLETFTKKNNYEYDTAENSVAKGEALLILLNKKISEAFALFYALKTSNR